MSRPLGKTTICPVWERSGANEIAAILLYRNDLAEIGNRMVIDALDIAFVPGAVLVDYGSSPVKVNGVTAKELRQDTFDFI